ncbi:arylamine N-acetyltransferase [Nonomuraea sp. K274]|uniref:Arylamine N-acetyltransferase n=1 Tax=Nonomuraea cypriaca TaxID=1187855 RepID=A0A931AF92_9ACTN|nr:arylamine N-acetyltransferase [Nonomuraea cypriaca]MBF8191862.1 arylamine N-acetyltransferase [Nonomuraea cypriaca]
MNTAAYLRRLGLPELLNAPTSAEGLRALHVAHVERVSYEALEIWLGRRTTVDPLESAQRIIGGRGGYCFHLNGAFSALAAALGYDVTRHVGGVQTRGEEPGITGDHLVLTVRGLPTDANPGGEWLADVGLGDALHEPLPLVAGTYRQGPFQYVLRPSEIARGWRFDHDPSGSFVGMDFAMAPTDMSAFVDMHRHLTTSPSSGFVRVAAAHRRDASGVDSLRGLLLSRVGTGLRSVTFDSARDYYAALADVFLLPLDDVSAGEKDKLWRKVHDAHEAWLAGEPA